MVIFKGSLFLVCCAWLVFDVTNGHVQILQHGNKGVDENINDDPRNISVNIDGPNAGSICIDCQNQIQLDTGLQDDLQDISDVQKYFGDPRLPGQLIPLPRIPGQIYPPSPSASPGHNTKSTLKPLNLPPVRLPPSVVAPNIYRGPEGLEYNPRYKSDSSQPSGPQSDLSRQRQATDASPLH